jgi:hypothetical protein
MAAKASVRTERIPNPAVGARSMDEISASEPRGRIGVDKVCGRPVTKAVGSACWLIAVLSHYAHSSEVLPYGRVTFRLRASALASGEVDNGARAPFTRGNSKDDLRQIATAQLASLGFKPVTPACVASSPAAAINANRCAARVISPEASRGTFSTRNLRL